MPKINLNQFPYYDDFDETDKYYQILFKPGKAVQARELTQLQTILQKQIERLGSHIFDEGAQVLPATESAVRYSNAHGFIKLAVSENNLTHTNTAIETYWLGKKITNQKGVEAQIIGYRPADSLAEIRLFLDYTKASDDGASLHFLPQDVITVVSSTPPISATIPSEAASNQTTLRKTGFISSVTIQQGVYFYSGYFVWVDEQRIFLTPSFNPDSVEQQNAWNNSPTASVGLQMTQSIKTFEDDSNLLDVATGSPNYAAPGADRLYIDAELMQKVRIVEEVNKDPNFVELLTVDNGEVTFKVYRSQNAALEKTLARRTYDESGDYTVLPFDVEVKEFLRNSTNHGVHEEVEFIRYTQVEAEELAIKKFKLVKDQLPVNSNLWCLHPTLVNPQAYLPGTSYNGSEATSFKNLCDSYISVRVSPGKAYVKGFEIQKFGKETVDIPKARTVAYRQNQRIFTPLGTHFEVTDVSGVPNFNQHQTIGLYNTRYNLFDANASIPSDAEKIGTAKMLFIELFDGTSGTKGGGTYRLYLYDIKLNQGQTIQSVKSFYSTSSSTTSTSFYANAALSKYNMTGSVAVRTEDANVNKKNITTLVGTGTRWKNDQKERLSENQVILVDEMLYRVAANPTTDTLLSVEYIGPYPNVDATPPNWENGAPFKYVFALPKSNSTDAGILYQLPDEFVATIRSGGSNPNENPFQKTTSSITYIEPRVFTGLRPINGKIEPSASLAENEKYVGIFNNQIALIDQESGLWVRLASALLTSDPSPNTGVVSISPTDVSVSNLPDSEYTLIVPVVIEQARERKKTFKKGYFDNNGQYVASFSIDNGSTTNNPQSNGGGYIVVEPGEAAEIFLGMADVLRITRVVESLDSTRAPSGKFPHNPDLEKIITPSYLFDDGQRDYYYDIAKVTLKDGAPTINGKVRVEFDYFVHENDGGKFFSVDSYGVHQDGARLNYGEIPTYIATDGSKYPLSDCIDFRRKITDATGRICIENLVCSYYKYLARKDKIFLSSKSKRFEVSFGTPSLNPVPADENPDGMTICELNFLPYTKDIQSISIKPINNRRYTMRDIGKLETRIKNLEYYTSLTLLELDTATLNITDANGNPRFKNGFLADNFFTYGMCDLSTPDFKCSLDTPSGIVRASVRPFNVGLYEAAIDQAQPDEYRQQNFYQKTDEIFTLPYTKRLFLRQSIASKVINVNPFNVPPTYIGDVRLTPWSDSWRDTELLPDIKINDDSAYQAALAAVGPPGSNINFQVTGANWTGSSTSTPTPTGRKKLYKAGHSIMEKLGYGKDRSKWPQTIEVPEGYVNAGDIVPVGKSNWEQEEFRSTTTLTGNEILTGLQQTVNDLGWSEEERVLTLYRTAQIEWMRSIEVEFHATSLKSDANMYPFFDDISVADECRPTPDNGWIPFKVTAGANILTIHSTSPNASFNTTGSASSVGTEQQHNIRVGAEVKINDRRFDVLRVISNTQIHVSPKNIPGQFSIELNSTQPIDILATRYTYGDQLKANANGTVKGVFKIPCNQTKKFRTGTGTFRLTTSSTNTKVPTPPGLSWAETNFYSMGWLDTSQYTVTQTRQFSISSQLVSRTGNATNVLADEDLTYGDPCRSDPICQTFLVRETGGCFVTGIDVFFFSKPGLDPESQSNPNFPVRLQLRVVEDGYPTEIIVAGDLGIVTKNPEEVIVNQVNLANQTITVTGNVGGAESTGANFTVPLTGTVSSAQSSTVIVGSGTKFKSELTVGSTIKDSATGQERTVVSVLSQTSATVNAPFLPALSQSTLSKRPYQWNANTFLKSENLEKANTTRPIISGVAFQATNADGMAADMVPTRFEFKSPIFLEENTDYGIVLLSDSNEYEVWIAQSYRDTDTPPFAQRVGKQDPGVDNKKIGTDVSVTPPIYADGNFYKSHNGSGWDIDNTVAMKFAVHKANFSTDAAAEINFVNEELFDRKLSLDCIELHEGSPRMRVALPNHSLSKGDKVAIRNIGTPADSESDPPKIKGIFQSVFENLKVVRVEMDHVILTNTAGTNGQELSEEGYIATESAKIGGRTATITDNRGFEDMTLITTPFNPPRGTSIEWKLVTTSSVGLNNVTHTPTKYPYINIVPNERIFFDSSRRVNAALNEPASDNPAEKKSLIVTAILRSTNPNLSPVIDVSRMSVGLTKYRLNDPYGTSDKHPQNINDVFDDLYLFQNGATPEGVTPAISQVQGLIKFSTSSGALTGKFYTDVDNENKLIKVPPTTTPDVDLRTQLRIGQTITLNGQTRKVVLIGTETHNGSERDYFTIEQPFNPMIPSSNPATIYSNPSKMSISTDNLNVANILNQLDVGKLVTIQNASSGRNFTDKRVLKVEFNPDALTDKCVVTFDFETEAGSGPETSSNLTIVQRDRFVDEISPFEGSAAAKYVCKKLVVTRPSNAIQIQFDANRDASCSIELYYKIESPNATVPFRSLPWQKAEFNIEVNGVLQDKTPDPNSTMDSYSEYQATINDLPEFIGAQAKIVMRGGNAARCPKIKNFRMIVLDD